MGFFGSIFKSLVTTKPIAIRSIESGEVEIVDTPPDDTSATIAVDVVKAAVRRYYDKVDELKRINAPEKVFKHLEIEFDDMCKSIIAALGSSQYIDKLLKEMKIMR